MKFLLSPGHGGIAFGHYLTPGKRSPEVPPGIYEGEFNRRVCDRVETRAPNKYLNIAPGPIQTPLRARVDFVNKLAKREKCALISIHGNASPAPGWSKASGFTIFISKSASAASERLAQLIHDEMEKHIDITIRSRGIKKANFTVLKRVNCSAVLVECGFMTDKYDAAFMASQLGVEAYASAINDACDMFDV